MDPEGTANKSRAKRVATFEAPGRSSATSCEKSSTASGSSGQLKMHETASNIQKTRSISEEKRAPGATCAAEVGKAGK
jgi:hypothetical protein